MPSIAFVIERKNFYRLFSPIIDEALQQGWDVECWHDWSHTKVGPKGYEFPTFDATPYFAHGQPSLKKYMGSTEFRTLLESNRVDAVLSLSTPAQFFGDDLPETTTRWIGIQHNFDYFEANSAAGIRSVDLTCSYSEYWTQLAASYYRESEHLQSEGPALSESVGTTVATGFPQLDQLESIDKIAVRNSLGIPKSQKVVLLLPYATFGDLSFWGRHIYGQESVIRQLASIARHRKFEYLNYVLRAWNDVSVIKAIRRFCDANDAFLLVKSRAKDPIPEYIERMADACIYDQGFYPSTIMEVMRIASMCISFYSWAVTESVYSNVPHLCLTPDVRKHWRHNIDFNDLRFKLYVNTDDGGPFNFDGVTRSMDIPDVIRDLPNMTVSDFEMDPRSRKAYVKKYLGFDDGKSSSRVLQAVESLLKS